MDLFQFGVCVFIVGVFGEGFFVCMDGCCVVIGFDGCECFGVQWWKFGFGWCIWCVGWFVYGESFGYVVLCCDLQQLSEYFVYLLFGYGICEYWDGLFGDQGYYYWNGLCVEVLGELWVCVYVDFGQEDLVVEFVCDLFEDGVELFVGFVLFGLEVDDYGYCVGEFQDLIECFVGGVYYDVDDVWIGCFFGLWCWLVVEV